MGHGCRICQSVAVGTAVGVAVGSGSSHPAVVNVRKTNSPPNHTEGRNPDFLSQHTSFTDGDPFSPPSTRGTRRGRLPRLSLPSWRYGRIPGTVYPENSGDRS
jgi:hypothetical protein